MSDLRCQRCGVTATYADANICDIRETCEETREFTEPDGTVRTATMPSSHEWIETT